MADAAKDAAKTEEIKKRQQLLFDAFRHNEVLGGRYFVPVVDAERAIGAKFVDTYYGHRVLTDSFLDFFGGTLLKQIELNNKIGWPNEEKNYATCLMMFLTIFSVLQFISIRAICSVPPNAVHVKESFA